MDCHFKKVANILKVNSTIFNQEKFIVPSVDIRLKFHRNRDNFSILAPDNNTAYKMKMYDICSFTRRIIPNNVLLLSLTESRRLKPVNYCTKRVRMSSNLLTPSATNYSWDITFSAAWLLTYTILFFVTNNNVTYNANPFKFLSLGVNNTYLVTNNQTHCRIAYQLDFANGLVSREYLDLLNLNDRNFTDVGTSVSIEMFYSGTTLFAFKFSGCKSDAHSLKQGTQGPILT